MENETGSTTPATTGAPAPTAAAPAAPATPPAAAADPAPAAPAAEGPKGQPDDAQKATRLENELAAAKQRETDLQAKLDAAKTADDVQKAVDEAKSAAQAQVKEIAVRAHLATAGCVNAEALVAAAHMDVSKVEVAQDGSIASGVDLEKLKTGFPYLFQTTAAAPATVTTGAPAAAAATGGEAKTIKEALAAMKKK